MSVDPTSLDRLHDIIAPPAAPWWPPALAWIVIGGVLIVALLIGLIVAAHSWQHNRYRRDALRELRRLERHRLPVGEQNVAASIAGVIKRTALTAWPREHVASLTGEAWWKFLDCTSADGHFAEQTGPTLDRAVYDDNFAATLSNSELEQLFVASRQWIKHHTTRAAAC